jgi:hypothetical protein
MRIEEAYAGWQAGDCDKRKRRACSACVNDRRPPARRYQA